MEAPIRELSGIDEWQSFEPGLERVKHGLKRLGFPHRHFRHFLVGGTNGKGTVSFNLARALGPSTGLFTSPHLIDVRERITLAGKPFPDSAWKKARDRILAVWPKPNLSYFEWLFLLAVEIFRQANVQDAVFEVGMGGRLDATNALSPELSILTQVSMDHQQFLGNTREEIALAKIEIARPEKPFFFPEDILAFNEVRSRIEIMGCLQKPQPISQRFEDNLNLVNQALEWLGHKPLEKLVLLPGRRERLGSDLILDGAHNPVGWRDLARWVQSLHATPLNVLCSLSKGRNPETFLEELRPVAKRFYHWHAGFEKELPAEHWPDSVTVIESGDLQELLKRPLLVCGSLYFVGAFKAWYEK